MMYYSAVLLSLCAAVLVYGVDAQKKCCTASQYEVRGSHTSYMEKGWLHREMVINSIYFPKISVDYTTKQFALQEWLFRENLNVTTLLDLNKGVGYIFSLEKKFCHKIKLHKVANASKPCIPEKAKYIGSARIGPEKGGLYSDTFGHGMKRGKEFEVFVMISVMREGCLPSYVAQEGKIKGKTYAGNMAYYDYTAGIKDPSVFKVPSVCESVEEELVGEFKDNIDLMASFFSE